MSWGETTVIRGQLMCNVLWDRKNVGCNIRYANFKKHRTVAKNFTSFVERTRTYISSASGLCIDLYLGRPLLEPLLGIVKNYILRNGY